MQEIEIVLEKEKNSEIEINLESEGKEIFPSLENLEVTPSKEQQVFNHENSYGYDEVKVNPIPDEYIIPDGTLPITENATYDVTNYARVSASVYPTPNLQDKELTINENGIHNIIADKEYDGLNQVSVTVNAIEDLTEELTTYNNELTEQETTIEDIIEVMKNKGIGEPPKYAPKYISFYKYRGTELDEELVNLDTTNITNMSSMFVYCSYLTSLNLSSFDTSNVTDMSNMFNDCSSLTSIDLSNFDTSKVKDMTSMFYYCSSLTSIDLSNFDTSKVTNIGSMFYYCSSLTSIDLSNFDTSKVTNMMNMFNSCSGLTSIDLSNFDTSNNPNTKNMFNSCSGLTSIIINNPNVFKMTNTNMFTSTPIASGTGYVYVPDDMVETYKAATNWSTYADQIKGVSELV